MPKLEPVLKATQTNHDEAFDRLRADVDFLGSALGTVITELEGERVFDLVERGAHPYQKYSRPGRPRAYCRPQNAALEHEPGDGGASVARFYGVLSTHQLS